MFASCLCSKVYPSLSLRFFIGKRKRFDGPASAPAVTATREGGPIWNARGSEVQFPASYYMLGDLGWLGRVGKGLWHETLLTVPVFLSFSHKGKKDI